MLEQLLRDLGAGLAAADFPIRVPGDTPSVVQEVHRVLLHTFCEGIESAMAEAS